MLSDIAAVDLPAIKLSENDWLRFELDPLTPYGKEVAFRELRETPELKKKASEELRALLQGEIDQILFMKSIPECTLRYRNCSALRARKFRRKSI